jgi:hypothetical protein
MQQTRARALRVGDNDLIGVCVHDKVRVVRAPVHPPR